MIYLIIFITSYLIGSISGSLIISRMFFNEDIRSKGSGNAGTTNIFRAYGLKYAALVLLIDLGKGLIAPFIAYYIDNQYGTYIAGSAVVIGHVWPIFFKFKGGKGMATSVGVYGYHNIIIALIQASGFLLSLAVIKIVSASSLLFTVVAFIYIVIFHGSNTPFIIMSLINSILVIYSHRDNIKRLIEGTEKQAKRMKG